MDFLWKRCNQESHVYLWNLGKIYLIHFLKFWNLPRFTQEISKFQKSELGKFISNFTKKHVITRTKLKFCILLEFIFVNGSYFFSIFALNLENRQNLTTIYVREFFNLTNNFGILIGSTIAYYVSSSYCTYISETAVRRCSWEKVFWKYAANLQENTHAEVWNRTSAWVFSCKFAVYFQNTFS